MRTWRDKTASSYCTAILGCPVVATYIPGLSNRARVIGKNHIGYSKHKMPDWILWHECGHLARANKKVASLINQKLKGISIAPNARQDEIEIVMMEVSAHVWAYLRAKELGKDRIAKEIVESVKDFKGTKIHEAARPILEMILAT